MSEVKLCANCKYSRVYLGGGLTAPYRCFHPDSPVVNYAIGTREIAHTVRKEGGCGVEAKWFEPKPEPPPEPKKPGFFARIFGRGVAV